MLVWPIARPTRLVPWPPAVERPRRRPTLLPIVKPPGGTNIEVEKLVILLNNIIITVKKDTHLVKVPVVERCSAHVHAPPFRRLPTDWLNDTFVSRSSSHLHVTK